MLGDGRVCAARATAPAPAPSITAKRRNSHLSLAVVEMLREFGVALSQAIVFAVERPLPTSSALPGVIRERSWERARPGSPGA